jgi:hypothetical protein
MVNWKGHLKGRYQTVTGFLQRYIKAVAFYIRIIIYIDILLKL